MSTVVALCGVLYPATCREKYTEGDLAVKYSYRLTLAPAPTEPSKGLWSGKFQPDSAEGFSLPPPVPSRWFSIFED